MYLTLLRPGTCYYNKANTSTEEERKGRKGYDQDENVKY
jgi:hypothetical protein